MGTMPEVSWDTDVAACLRVLQKIVDDRGALSALDQATRRELLTLAGTAARPEVKDRKKLVKAMRKKERDTGKQAMESARRTTGIRQLRAQPVFVTPPLLPSSSSENALPAELPAPKKCYVCKQPYTTLHHFYDQLCTACGDLNYARRTQTVDLTGRTALVTGARVKIGYQGAIKLLRAGCRVIVTTRFPIDAALRYAAELDYAAWRDRLVVFGLDLRHTPSVETLARHVVQTEERLDFVIHNACQTVRRPPGFYDHLMEAERADPPAHVRAVLAAHAALGARGLPPGAVKGLTHSAALSQAALVDEDARSLGAGELFPQGALDADLQQIDLRAHNSWRLTMHEVPVVELLEVHLVNAIAPFVMTARLKPLMTREKTFDKHVVNVSAMEGQFYRAHKTDKHPHTNMAKAALNMLTRTSAQDFAQDGIWMNAVDTGWVTDEDPAEVAQKKVDVHAFSPPLDIVDGAARIVDPIFTGFKTGAHAWGVFFKDYLPAPW